MSDEDEDAEARGYIYTHWDCPLCEFDNVTEGHCQGEKIECEGCGKSVRVGNTT